MDWFADDNGRFHKWKHFEDDRMCGGDGFSLSSRTKTSSRLQAAKLLKVCLPSEDIDEGTDATRPNSQNEGMKVLLDDHVLNRVHGCFEQCGVGSICVVNVNLAIRHAIDAFESVCEVFAGGVEIGR